MRSDFLFLFGHGAFFCSYQAKMEKVVWGLDYAGYSGCRQINIVSVLSTKTKMISVLAIFI